MITRRNWIAGSLLSLPIASAADAWKKKSSDWSEKDVQQLLNRSPWTRSVLVEFNIKRDKKNTPVAPPPPGGRPEMPGQSIDGSMGRMGYPSGGLPVENGGPGVLPEFHAFVRWESAAPIRLALKKAADVPANMYILTVGGFPLMREKADPKAGITNPGPNPDDLLYLKRTSTLQAGAKAPLHVSKLEHRDSGSGIVLTYMFDGSEQPIEEPDREAFFATGLGPLRMNVKFALHDMMYQGKLAI